MIEHYRIGIDEWTCVPSMEEVFVPGGLNPGIPECSIVPCLYAADAIQENPEPQSSQYSDDRQEGLRLDATVLDLVADDGGGMQKPKSVYHWDKRSKKYIKLNNGESVSTSGKFLPWFRNTNIGFVGNSLNRNMFASLVCTLKQVSKEVKKWRPAGADHGFTFLHYNLTVAYHRTNLLAYYGWWSTSVNGGVVKGIGYKEGFRVDLDIPEGTWAEVSSFHDVLILNKTLVVGTFKV
ncbi:hypothetical protein GIB67_012038 [Kingdonia uniflora]|uniref:Uncharacterized protein n=1 Tax=Kingdonia uniflora TaxID=39325 RepID=A0A7J7M068_9MAGN|nr:hypothetical protein GIB67_012038 [Kingdonia uniflora]